MRKLFKRAAIAVAIIIGIATPAYAFNSYYNDGVVDYNPPFNGSIAQASIHDNNTPNLWANMSITNYTAIGSFVCLENWTDTSLWGTQASSGVPKEHRAPDVLVNCGRNTLEYLNLPLHRQGSTNPVPSWKFHNTDNVMCIVTPPNYARSGFNCTGSGVDMGPFNNLDYDQLRANGINTPEYILGRIDRLWSGWSLFPGEMLVDRIRGATLRAQQDGNIVEYRDDGFVCWQTGTNQSGYPTVKFFMQGDGNLVLYKNNVAVWSSQTNGHPGAFLRLDENGSLVLREANNTYIKTISGTCQ